MGREMCDYTSQQLIDIIVQADEEADAMGRKWLATDLAGRAALIGMDPRYDDVRKYIEARDSVIEARDHAIRTVGKDIIILSLSMSTNRSR